MFKINNWKEHIYKDDLIAVLINGLIVAILSGIIAGGLDYLFSYFKIQVSFGLLIIAFCIGYRIKKAYYTFHILYPVLALLFMIFGLFVSHITLYICILGIVPFFSYFFTPNFFLTFVQMPIINLIIYFQTLDIKNLLLGILDIVIVIWSFIFCYRLAKGRN